MQHAMLTIDNPFLDVPQNTRFLYIARTDAYVQLYAGGAGGPFLVDCPRGESRVIAWPTGINKLHCLFFDGLTEITVTEYPEAANMARCTIWYSDLPIRVDQLNTQPDPVGGYGLKGGIPSLPFQSQTRNFYAVPLTGLAAEFKGSPNDSVSTRYGAIQSLEAAKEMQQYGYNPIEANTHWDRYVLRTAESREKVQTFRASAFATTFPSAMGHIFAVAGRVPISYLDFNQGSGWRYDLIGCQVELKSVSAACDIAIDLVRFEDVTGITTTVGMSEIRLDDIPDETLSGISGIGFRCTGVANTMGADEEVITRKEYTFGAASTSAIDIELVPSSPNVENNSSPMPQVNASGSRKYGVVIQVGGAVTTRTIVNWLFTARSRTPNGDRGRYV